MKLYTVLYVNYDAFKIQISDTVSHHYNTIFTVLLGFLTQHLSCLTDLCILILIQAIICKAGFNENLSLIEALHILFYYIISTADQYFVLS